MKDNDVSQRFSDLRRQSREQHLELMGIKVEALRKLERKVDKEFAALADEVKKGLREQGTDEAKLHANSLKRTRALIQKEIEGIIRPGLTDLDYAHRLFCICFSHNYASEEGTGNDPEIIKPPSGGTGSASVTFDPTGCVGHPIVDAEGQGSPSENSADLTSYCRFAFTPSGDGTYGTYCVNPLVYMNGHYLIWTWGSCGGTAEDRGTAEVKVELTVQIDQLSLPVKAIHHAVIDQTVTDGSDAQSGFAYDSAIDGGARTSVILKNGDQAVVWVKCRCLAKVKNNGRAWVDMQTSPQFYFKVDHVRWGPAICWSMVPETMLPSLPALPSLP